MAELFAYIGVSKVSRGLQESILRRFRESPLQFEDIRTIWNRDNRTHPSRYTEAMADNIVNFMCIPKLQVFAINHDIDPNETYKEVVMKKMKRMNEAFPGKERSVGGHQLTYFN